MDWMPTRIQQCWTNREIDAVLSYLASPPALTHAWSPLFDPRALELPDGTSTTPLDVLTGLADETVLPLGPGQYPRALRWTQARDCVIATLTRLHTEQQPETSGTGEQIDWATARQALADRAAGRTSAIVFTRGESRRTARAVRALLAARDDSDLEIIIVDSGSPRKHALALSCWFCGVNGVRVIRNPRDLGGAIGSNIGLVASTGERVVFLSNATRVWPGWLEPLVVRLQDQDVRGVQSLLLNPDDTIWSAGMAYPAENMLPAHLATGLPREDALALGDYPLSCVTRAALTMRAADAVEVEGFDPTYVHGMDDADLCLRALRKWGGHFAVEPTSVVTHHAEKTPRRAGDDAEDRRTFLERWRDRLPGPELEPYGLLGMQVRDIGADRSPYPAPLPALARLRRTTTIPDGRTVPRLRWAFHNPASPGPRGERWGDTHFIDAIARELRGLGQDAVSYRRGSYDVPATAFDDVVVALRGLERIHPHPDKINLLWVISHPDEVTIDEINDFDLVFAASIPWAERMSRRTDRPVIPMLQATDPAIFHPRDPGVPATEGVVFVGQARIDGPRRIVMDARSVGVDVALWGTRWSQYVPADEVRGEYVSNSELGALYRTAAIVLNDHWDDMATEGFISNRIFDAVASGSRVVSDHVEGVEELFGGAVQIYRTPEDLLRLGSGAGNDAFPGDEALRKIAARVADEHSFARRASQLLDAVLALRGDR